MDRQGVAGEHMEHLAAEGDNGGVLRLQLIYAAPKWPKESVTGALIMRRKRQYVAHT